MFDDPLFVDDVVLKLVVSCSVMYVFLFQLCICLEYRTLVDIKFTTRHCKLDECEFGCCHDYAALLEIIEKRLGYNFGKVQHQSKVTKGRRGGVL
jgi:hypothetical protein